MATGFATWADVAEILRIKGVATAYIKQLAPNQDNEKNQVYLAKQKGASPFSLIEHTLPLTFKQRKASTSSSKKKSKAGTPILESPVRWNWVDRAGHAHAAPNTKVIFYLQYPEIRLSGFVGGCRDHAPNAMRREHMDDFGSRALVFGTGSSGEVYALVVTEKEDRALFTTDFAKGPPRRGTKRRSVMRIAGLLNHPQNSALYCLRVIPDGLPKLLSDLRAINRRGWVPSQRLHKAAQPSKPFRGSQGGGYTLEALLGIVSNASKTPDRDGVEVKSFSRNKVSLMTPTPDGGVQGVSGLLKFLEIFGYPDKNDPTCRKFNGSHKYGKPHKKTKLTLLLSGYETALGFTGPEANVLVSLVDQATGTVAASWSYPRLFESWNRKHFQAVYVSSRKRKRDSDPDHDADYQFADLVWVCEGTTSRNLLDSIISGDVIYDPGDTSKSKKTGKPKERPQWRVSNLKSLKKLYASVTKVTFP